jgi:hypothetical protein
VPSGHIPPSGNSSYRSSSTRPTGVCPFAWPAEMDSDDDEEQMFAEMFEEEMAA